MTTFLWKDNSLNLLVLTNVIAIFLAIYQGWSLATVIWVYWFQSLTIGFFNFLRIASLKKFTTNRGPATLWAKWFTACFFVLHFGLFHLIYLVYLRSGAQALFLGQDIGAIDMQAIFVPAVIFFANHWYSHRYHRPRDSEKQNIDSLALYPYARIVPMHLTIVFGAFFVSALPVFLALKTCADVAMHVFEHRVIKKAEEV